MPCYRGLCIDATSRDRAQPRPCVEGSVLLAAPCETHAVRFETTMAQLGNNTGIEVPPEVIEALGGGKRPALNVTVNGFEYRSTVGVMGGKALIPFSSDKRAAT